MTVGPEGGTWNAFCGEVTVTLAPGTFTRPDYLIIRKLSGGPPPLAGLRVSGAAKPLFVLAQVSPMYELAAGEAAPRKPVRVLIRYDEGRLGGGEPRKLGVYRQDARDPDAWKCVGGRWEAESGAVEAFVRSWGRLSVLMHDRSFSDIQGHWAQRDVELLASRHVVSGVTAKEFLPEAPLTRAQAAKLITEMLARNPESPVRWARPAEPTFRDVQPTDWFYSYVETAAEYGAVKGYGGVFRPRAPVTREELAAMIVRALGWEPGGGAPGNAPFADAVTASPWARVCERRPGDGPLHRAHGYGLRSPAERQEGPGGRGGGAGHGPDGLDRRPGGLRRGAGAWWPERWV